MAMLEGKVALVTGAGSGIGKATAMRLAREHLRVGILSRSTAYSCGKAAQVTMAQMLALELAKHHIRVNAVCPGAIETEIDQNTDRRNVQAAKEPVDYPEGEIPLTDRPGTSEDVAELIAFLVSDRARHISGSPVWVDGTQSLLIG